MDCPGCKQKIEEQQKQIEELKKMILEHHTNNEIKNNYPINNQLIEEQQKQIEELKKMILEQHDNNFKTTNIYPLNNQLFHYW